MLLEHIAGQVESIQQEMELMRNNNVNITYAMKDIEKIKESLEKIKYLSLIMVCHLLVSVKIFQMI